MSDDSNRFADLGPGPHPLADHLVQLASPPAVDKTPIFEAAETNEPILTGNPAIDAAADGDVVALDSPAEVDGHDLKGN